MEGSTSKQPRGALLISNLPALQNLIKRDPKAYTDEFLVQWNAYTSTTALLQLGNLTGETEEKWCQLVNFIGNLASCFPDITSDFPDHIAQILLNTQSNLTPETKKTLVHSLIMLRHKEQITSLQLLQTLFPLLGMTPSPNLRGYILKTIMTDLKLANKKSKNHKLNRTVQGLLFNMIDRGLSSNVEGSGLKRQRKVQQRTTASDREAMLAVKLSTELFKKGIWSDAKTVQIVANACFHSNTKVASAAMHFFLAVPSSEDDDEDSDEEKEAIPDLKKMYHQSTINKTRRSTKRKEALTVKEANKKRKRAAAKAAESNANFGAIHLLLDPQDFVEKLYELLLKNDKVFTLEHRIVIMQLFGRITGVHKLTVLGFYSYATRFLTHHQAQVTSILVAVASSVHELTPPDVLFPVVRKLANEFVHPGCSAEVIAAGLNAIREICRRQPLAMEKDLLEDLTEYKKSRDKGVMYASRGLLQLYREVDPALLRRRERGKLATVSGKDKEMPLYGQAREGPTSIEGLDLLAAYMKERAAQGLPEEDEEAQWKAWENASADEDTSDDEGGWIAVSDDEGDIHISDSESESEKKPAKRTKSASPEPEAGAEEEDHIQFEFEDDDDDASDDSDSDSDSDEEQEEPEAADGDAEEAFRNLASQQILTPADFAKLNELRMQAAEEEMKQTGGSNAARKKLADLAAARKAQRGAEQPEFLTESEILGYRKKQKDDYEARMASIAKGREGREKFGSRKGQKKAEKGSSSTNFEKRKNKAFMMTLHSNAVRSKKAASLRDKQKKLRGHINRQKKRMK